MATPEFPPTLPDPLTLATRPYCACSVLSFPLVKQGLPDHVCPDTMRASVKYWLQDQHTLFAPILEEISAHLPEPKEPVPDFVGQIIPGREPAPIVQKVVHSLGDFLAGQSPELDRAFREFRRLGWLRENHGVFSAVSEVWPFPIGWRRLGLVIRQWVEAEPSETLATLLDAQQGWHEVVDFYGGLYRKAREADAALTPEEWLRWHGSVGSGHPRPAHTLLQLAKLPYSPATVAHLHACAVGLAKPLPSYGLLVTTRVYVLPGEAKYLIDLMPEFSLTGDLEFAKGDLLAKAQGVIRAHRDWVRAQTTAQHPLTASRHVHMAAKGSFASGMTKRRTPEYFDYARQAVESAPLILLARLSGDRLEQAISKHIATVQRRVYKRRKDNGIGVEPPTGWTKEVRALIHVCLHGGAKANRICF